VFTDESKIIHSNIAEVLVPQQPQKQTPLKAATQSTPTPEKEPATQGNSGYQLNGMNSQ